jgi:hypothetical protein
MFVNTINFKSTIDKSEENRNRRIIGKDLNGTVNNAESVARCVKLFRCSHGGHKSDNVRCSCCHRACSRGLLVLLRQSADTFR